MKYRPTKSNKWANQRINRRLIQEYGLEETKKLGFLDTDKDGKDIKKKKKKKRTEEEHKEWKKQKYEKKQKKLKEPKYNMGELYEENLQKFLDSGGDLKECPFD